VCSVRGGEKFIFSFFFPPVFGGQGTDRTASGVREQGVVEREDAERGEGDAEGWPEQRRQVDNLRRKRPASANKEPTKTRCNVQ